MKDSHIYIFKNIENMELLAGFITIKEQFVKNSFIEESYVLICLPNDLIKRKEILFDKIKKNILTEKGYSIDEFTIKYSQEIKNIYEFKEKNNENLSWLEIFQLAVLLKEKEHKSNNVIKELLGKIMQFYSLIEKKY